MKTTAKKRLVAVALIASSVLSLCGGCNSSCNSGCNGLELHPIYKSALIGALIGGIVGYQSEEPGEGAAVGAVIFGVGELLKQIDEQSKAEKVIVDIHNSNGSVTPVELKKKDCIYIGPKGEHYEQLPTEEQLRPEYGL